MSFDFNDPESVERHVADQRRREEALAQEVEARYRALIGSASHRLKRSTIRCGRIVAGLALAFVAVLILDNKTEIADTPFAQLTLGLVLGNLASWLFAALFFWWAWRAAFGPRPTEADLRTALHERVRQEAAAADVERHVVLR